MIVPAATGTFATCVLHTGDLASSARHYRDVLGWELETLGGVPTFTRDGRRVAVACAGSAVPDAWVPAVAVEDVDVSTNTAVENGATVVEPPAARLDGSRWSVVRDPDGALIGLCSGTGGDVVPLTAERHALWWIEILAKRPDALQHFYGALFGWRFTAQPLAPHPLYVTCRLGDAAVGGLLPIGEGWPVDPRWQPIVAVDDLARTVGRARAAGGAPQVGPLDVPAAGTLTSVCDPRGALYVLVQARDRVNE